MVWDTEFLTVQCGPFRDGWLQGHSAVSSHRAGRVPEGSKYWGAGLMRPRFSYVGISGVDTRAARGSDVDADLEMGIRGLSDPATNRFAHERASGSSFILVDDSAEDVPATD